MSEHTPGPWFLVSDNLAEDCAVIETRSGEEVLGVSEWIRADVPDLRLMSAAPDLLKALVSLELTAGIPAMEDDPARVAARAAIAKAKGEQR